MNNNKMNNNYRNNDYNNDYRTTIYYDDSFDRQLTKENTSRDFSRPTEDARAYSKAKRTRQNILLSCAAFALVAAIAVGGMAAGGLFNQKPTTTTPTATVSATVDKGANKAAQTTKQATPQTETKQSNTAVKPTQNTTQNTTQNKSTTQTAQNSTKQSATQQSATQQADTKQTQKSEDKIENVNGERVYKDTKRQAPDKTGTPAHYYANGKTSYGFNWDYDTDNANFVVKCDYNFNQQQYDFTFYGSTPGTAHVTLYYYTSDTNKVPVNLTVTVDSNLNVSVG
jgi:hypothetical protein